MQLCLLKIFITSLSSFSLPLSLFFFLSLSLSFSHSPFFPSLSLPNLSFSNFLSLSTIDLPLLPPLPLDIFLYSYSSFCPPSLSLLSVFSFSFLLPLSSLSLFPLVCFSSLATVFFLLYSFYFSFLFFALF